MGDKPRTLLLFIAAAGLLLLGYLILGPVAEWMAVGNPPNPESVDAMRERWIQFLALGTVVVGVLNWRDAVKRRITDRFIASLDLLGAETETRRVAGAYALEQVAREDPRLHAQIVDILGALVRDVTRDPAYEARMTKKWAGRKIRPQQDVQAALSVLGRRSSGREEHGPLRLSDTYLTGANLRGAFLRDARLRRSILRDARLEEADLQAAELRDADLTGADLERADLRGANLTGAILAKAKLGGAHLSGAVGMSAEASIDPAHCRPEAQCAEAP